MTSQQYLTAREVNRPLWTHWLAIVKPARVTSDIGLLFITGGDNSDTPPDSIDPLAPDIATSTGAVVATVYDIPNEPLIFAGESASDLKTPLLRTRGASS